MSISRSLARALGAVTVAVLLGATHVAPASSVEWSQTQIELAPSTIPATLLTEQASGLTVGAATPAVVQPGASVSLEGTGFSPSVTGNAVSVNGRAAVVTSATESNLTFTVPSAVGSGPISITTGGSTVESDADLYVTLRDSRPLPLQRPRELLRVFPPR